MAYKEITVQGQHYTTGYLIALLCPELRFGTKRLMELGGLSMAHHPGCLPGLKSRNHKDCMWIRQGRHQEQTMVYVISFYFVSLFESAESTKHGSRELAKIAPQRTKAFISFHNIPNSSLRKI